MRELFIGIMTMIGLYLIGRVLYPDMPHRPIQQELINWEEEE